MMLYPPVAELVDKVGSRYQLVNLVARRARVLAAEAEDHTVTLDKKPVSASRSPRQSTRSIPES